METLKVVILQREIFDPALADWRKTDSYVAPIQESVRDIGVERQDPRTGTRWRFSIASEVSIEYDPGTGTQGASWRTWATQLAWLAQSRDQFLDLVNGGSLPGLPDTDE